MITPWTTSNYNGVPKGDCMASRIAVIEKCSIRSRYDLLVFNIIASDISLRSSTQEECSARTTHC